MYGTIFRMRPRRGREREVAALFEEWGQNRAPHVRGARAGYVMHPDNRPDELIGVAMFADRASYRANAEDPGQNDWYMRLRELLEADPVWEDGEYVVVGTGNPEARTLITTFFDAFNEHDLDRAAAMTTPDSEWVDMPAHLTLVGPQGLRQTWQTWYAAFPDARVELVSQTATDDGVVTTEFIGHGTHNGPLMGPRGQEIAPTGRRVDVPFCQIATVKDGRVAGGKLYYDALTMLAQLGSLPPSEQATR